MKIVIERQELDELRTQLQKIRDRLNARAYYVPAAEVGSIKQNCDSSVRLSSVLCSYLRMCASGLRLL